jgi:hypothetical protein
VDHVVAAPAVVDHMGAGTAVVDHMEAGSDVVDLVTKQKMADPVLVS